MCRAGQFSIAAADMQRLRALRLDPLMAQAGVGLFVELGAGKVLTGLVKRIADQAEGVACGAPDDIVSLKSRLGF